MSEKTLPIYWKKTRDHDFEHYQPIVILGDECHMPLHGFEIYKHDSDSSYGVFEAALSMSGTSRFDKVSTLPEARAALIERIKMRLSTICEPLGYVKSRKTSYQFGVDAVRGDGHSSIMLLKPKDGRYEPQS